MGADPQWRELTAPTEVRLKHLLCFRVAELAKEPRNPYTASPDKITIVSVLFHLLTPAAEN